MTQAILTIAFWILFNQSSGKYSLVNGIGAMVATVLVTAILKSMGAL